MKQLLDLDRFPLDRPDGVDGWALLARCRRGLRETGMLDLPGLIRPIALERCVAEVEPALRTAAFIHWREHNIYVAFSDTERLGFYGRKEAIQ